jgi:hypothetical protein
MTCHIRPARNDVACQKSRQTARLITPWHEAKYVDVIPSVAEGGYSLMTMTFYHFDSTG